MSDAADVYNCITPGITRYMFWEPPTSFEAYKARREAVLQSEHKSELSFVIRLPETMECLGIAALDEFETASPELGIWLKEAAHCKGYGSEAVRAVANWASKTLGKQSFIYPVATQNVPSRRIAESFGGRIVGTRTSPKYDSVVYQICWKRTASKQDTSSASITAPPDIKPI